MALFEALGDLVASAILSAAPACDLTVPAELATEPAALLSWFKAHDEAEPVNDIVDALAREIWVSAETRTLSQQALELHAAGIASLLAAHPPARSHLSQAIERARTGMTGAPGASEPVARRIAVDIFSRARAAGAVGGAGLRDDVTLFMIDRVYAHLLDDPKVLFSMAGTVSDYISQHTAGAANQTKDPRHALRAYGLSAALTQKIEAAGGVAYLADLSERFSVGEQAMRRVLSTLDAQKHPADEQISKLEEVLAWLGDARAQLQRPTNEEADVRRLKARAAAALGDGDFELAADALRGVRREVRETRRRIEERLQDEVQGLRAQMLEEARATARLAELALASGQSATAAELFSDAALSLPNSDRANIWKYGLLRAEALLRDGQQRNDTATLGEALAAYSQSVRHAADGSNQQGLALASFGLGNTLLEIGKRESGTTRLKDAIAAYRKSLQLQARTEDPRTWGLAQLRLGRALALVGDREQSIVALREATQAFREALKEIRTDRSPGDFAAGQMGLGGVLLALEEHEGGGLPLLEEAASAYSAALEVLPREDMAAERAEASMSLGLALLGLGEQSGSVPRLEASIAAFRLALDSYPRHSAPQKWALTQMNLGNALAALGDKSGDAATARLEDAIACYNAALTEFKRDIEPLKWAITQMNLGTALIRLGEHRDKRRHWLAAAGALVPALEVFETERADAYADVTRRSLKRFHESWEALIAGPNDPPAEQPAPRRMPRAV